MENLTPQEIVDILDRYIIGQHDAKRTIAIALRNRYRRMQLDEEMQAEVTPKNILMIGDTGVGKTEIARRLAKMLHLPFVKVEASKYTEVGFVGRDVESIIRDLALNALHLVKDQEREKISEKIEAYIEERILEKVLPPLPSGASEEKKEDYARSKARMQTKLHAGELDHLTIKVEVREKIALPEDGLPPQMAQMQESLFKALGAYGKKGKEKEVSIQEAKELLRDEASDKLLDEEKLKTLAKERVEKGGIVFIDEIDKVAVSSTTTSRQDPSKEGVQRDLLPIVEGSTVQTKLGAIKTDHILFIAAGAFHLSKPSDLIPELQGRFPLRVELESLDEEALYRILTEPANSLVKQYQALLGVEEVKLIFEEEALKTMADFAHKANVKSENIGARRLHTILERVLEDISFEAHLYRGKEYVVSKVLVEQKLGSLVEDEDATKYIL